MKFNHSMKPIIRVDGLGKQFRIGARQARYKTLRESIVSAAQSPFRKFNRDGKSEGRSIWALKDVSFEVAPGEVVGIIGRNGAGKSTLLKILSRITEPTTGRVELYGRAGSLLEVGTGFHPELTGRENIYLNGAILGMKRGEIDRKFDEIVAFAEIENFIDTPIKHYSSGMYMRLALSVAAHLETEILIVDEVLAVGDVSFQKKCMGKLEEVRSRGRTVLFVSHNVPMVMRLCSRAILLEKGRILEDGPSQHVTRHYLKSGSSSPAERIWPDSQDAPGDSVARLRAVRALDEEGRLTHTIDIRKPLLLEIEYWNLQTKVRPTAVFHVMNEDGIRLFATNEFNNSAWRERPLKPGLVRARCRIPGNFLAEGLFSIFAAVVTYNPDIIHVYVPDAVSVQIVDHSEGDGVRGVFSGSWPGMIRPMLEWEVDYSGGGIDNVASMPSVCVDG
jgi:homopolymeric O-antigen transport system ATP-binding protein